MGQLDTIVQVTLQQAIDFMWLRVAQINCGGNVAQAKQWYYIRLMMSEDWDSHTESDYSYDWDTAGDQTTAGSAFQMRPVEKFQAVLIAGWHNGTLDANDMNHLEVWIGTTKKREYPGYPFNQQEYGLTMFIDPLIAMKGEDLQVIPNVAAAASADERAGPFGFVILQR